MIRPAVIGPESASALDELRRFRHLVRNVYTFNLVPEKMTPEESAAMLEAARNLLADIEPFEAETIEQPLRDLAGGLTVTAGQLLGTLRWATTNRKATPPLFGTLVAIGRERVLERLDAGIERLRESR